METKPYSSKFYNIVDREATPPTVVPTFGNEHKTEGAARKYAKQQTMGCLRNGPKNIAVITGPDGFREVWIQNAKVSGRGRSFTARVVPVQFYGEFRVVEAEKKEA